MQAIAQVIPVASFTDAWIETVLQNLSVKPPESHLLQMRGLKLKLMILMNMSILSHLLQMRGLKLCSRALGQI